MLFSFWLRRLRASLGQAVTGRKSRAARRKRRAPVRLALDCLEDRTVPSTFVVTNTSDNAATVGSLRWAINQVNADTTDTAANPDTIAFNITAASDAAGGGTGYSATTGVATIQLGSSLPEINAPAVIDGYSQAGASRNTLATADNAVLKIVLDGSGINTNGDIHPTDYPILTVGYDITVQGLVISGGPGVGVYCVGSRDTLSGNFIGTDVTGTVAEGNGGADVWARGSGTLIGGTTPDARNVISGALSVPGFPYGTGVLDNGTGDVI
jgi:hypothetical protein